ncbi:MAG: histidinol-phosphatase HisJ family protein [Clostridiales Family XIII bacterium]|jgi:histidinol-phosphatase (PHP family)|nr:histidinol-phosphatase HisJ family protein [Clostridiales Family XIII bacterium]
MFDYHTHSNFSYDHIGGSSMEELVCTAIEVGLDEIAITDHYDPNFPADEANLDFPAYKKQLLELKETYKDRIRVVPGIELGIRPGATLQSCSDEIVSFPYEFVIASVHSAGDHPIHRQSFREGRTDLESVIFYYEWTLECIKAYDNFDVLGHINVIDRYLPTDPEESLYIDCIEAIFRVLIEKGKGIEINTSNYRYGQVRTIPTLSMLKLYRSLGGEIVTTGSDSHGVRYIGKNLSDAQELLRAAGFTHLTTFENRMPVFRTL